MGMALTWLDLNTWLIELGSRRILLDPWLVGPMTFGLPSWLLQLFRPSPRPCPDRLDVVLLSQGLPDHCHPPSLACLDRNIPVIAPPSAAKVLQTLEFERMTILKPGESHVFGDLHIQATLGSAIGPLQQENGYVLQSTTTLLSVYYEPHGQHDPGLATFGPVDVVITPISDVTIPGLGAIISGLAHAETMLTGLRPQVIVPTAQLGNLQASGLLAKLFSALEMTDALDTGLEGYPDPPQILNFAPGQRLEITLKRQAPHPV